MQIPTLGLSSLEQTNVPKKKQKKQMPINSTNRVNSENHTKNFFVPHSETKKIDGRYMQQFTVLLDVKNNTCLLASVYCAFYTLCPLCFRVEEEKKIIQDIKGVPPPKKRRCLKASIKKGRRKKHRV